MTIELNVLLFNKKYWSKNWIVTFFDFSFLRSPWLTLTPLPSHLISDLLFIMSNFITSDWLSAICHKMSHPPHDMLLSLRLCHYPAPNFILKIEIDEIHTPRLLPSSNTVNFTMYCSSSSAYLTKSKEKCNKIRNFKKRDRFSSH